MTPVRIEYGAVLNVRPNSGHLPMVWIDGRTQGHTYAPSGYGVSDAVRIAEERARETAQRYCGDWDVTITQREAA